jgi:hypothetical protein
LSLRSDDLDSVDELYTEEDFRQPGVTIEATPNFVDGLVSLIVYGERVLFERHPLERFPGVPFGRCSDFQVVVGAAAAMWNRVGANGDLQFAQLLYVSGFLCAALAMRSLLSMVPLMRPTLALWVLGKLWLPRLSLRRAPPAFNSDKL